MCPILFGDIPGNHKKRRLESLLFRLHAEHNVLGGEVQSSGLRQVLGHNCATAGHEPVHASRTTSAGVDDVPGDTTAQVLGSDSDGCSGCTLCVDSNTTGVLTCDAGSSRQIQTRVSVRIDSSVQRAFRACDTNRRTRRIGDADRILNTSTDGVILIRRNSYGGQKFR